MLFLFQAQDLINRHIQHRQEDRMEDPDRFNIQPSIGMRCIRRPLPQTPHSTLDKDSPQKETQYLIKESE